MENRYMKYVNYIISVICMTIIVACGRHGGFYDEYNDTDSTRIKKLIAIDDSIYKSAPSAKAIIRKGMKQAKDSIEWCEYAVRMTKLYIKENKSDSIIPYINKIKAYISQQPATPRNNNIYGLALEYEAGWRQLLYNDIKIARILHKKAYDKIMQSDNKSIASDIMANLADCNYLCNDLPKAASYYRRALFLVDSLQLPKNKNLTLYMGLSRIYESLGDLNEALRFYKQTEKYLDQMPQNMQVFFLSSFGSYYYKTRDYKKSIQYFNRMEKYVRKTEGDDCLDMALCRINSADVYLNLNNLDKAKEYLHLAEPVFKKNAINIGIYYANTIKIGILLKEKKYAEIKEILDNEHADEDSMEFMMQKIRNTYLRDYYVATGNPAAALANKIYEDEKNDSVAKSNSYMRASEVIQRFSEDTLALHHDIVMAEKERKASEAKTTITILTASILILTLIFVLWWMYTRKKQVSAQMERFILRLENTRNRISPHFIFNVLNNRIYTAGQKEKDELMSLAKLIRKSLDISRDTFISLDEELDFVKNYIEVQSYILRPDFKFTLNIQPGIENILIPSMSIQILAENAIKHGLKGLERQQNLTITVIKENDITTITVEDNGRGFDSTKGSGNGLGMNIIRQTIAAVNKRSKKAKMDMDVHNIKDNEGNVSGCRIAITIKGKINPHRF